MEKQLPKRAETEALGGIVSDAWDATFDGRPPNRTHLFLEDFDAEPLPDIRELEALKWIVPQRSIQRLLNSQTVPKAVEILVLRKKSAAALRGRHANAARERRRRFVAAGEIYAESDAGRRVWGGGFVGGRWHDSL